MGFGESLLGITGFAALEAYLLVRTTYQDADFQRLFWTAFGVNTLLKLIWDIVIYPKFFSPLRHLPKAPGYSNHAKIIFDNPRGRLPLHWIKTIPNDGIIHFRDTINQSYLLATNHQALLDIVSTNSYDFEKPWRVRAFLARIIGFGLILSEGSAHKKQRKALTPVFHIKNVRALYRLMWEKTGLLLAELDQEIQMNPVEGTNSKNGVGKVEMSVWASRLTLDIIGPAAMGRDFRSLQNPENKVPTVSWQS